MKEVAAHLTAEQWTSLIHTIELAIAGTIAALGAVIVNIIIAWRTGQKVELHDARSTARAREAGQPPNPTVEERDRGHLK